jgi:endonuclease/exonuclease/phosphatase (EEP) superfamily protein YafD
MRYAISMKSCGHFWIFLTIVASVCTITGFLGGRAWLFDLTSNFRVQYSIILLIAVFVFLGGGRFQAAFIAAVFSAVNLYAISPFEGEVHARTRPVPVEGQMIRAVVLNVNHLNREYGEVIRFIELNQPEFLLLIEVNDEWLKELDSLRSDFPYEKSLTLENDGIALLSRVPFKTVSIGTIGRVGFPSIIARFDAGGQPFTLIGAHPRAPILPERARLRNRQIEALQRFVASNPGPIVLMGDLNNTPWSPIFEHFLHTTGLRDTREGYGLSPTWPALFPLLWIPIDHVLVSPEVAVHNRRVGSYVGSDHFPVLIDFSIQPVFHPQLSVK